MDQDEDDSEYSTTRGMCEICNVEFAFSSKLFAEHFDRADHDNEEDATLTSNLNKVANLGAFKALDEYPSELTRSLYSHWHQNS
jgi:hypothetical protein